MTMPLVQLIYASQPFGFDDAMLSGILRQARRNNAAAAITGALICRHDIYLQLLEGPPATIEALYARIIADDRHLAPVLLWSGTAEARLFPAWAMHDDPARTWLWSPAEIAGGAVRRASAADLHDVFAKVAYGLTGPAPVAAPCPHPWMT